MGPELLEKQNHLMNPEALLGSRDPAEDKILPLWGTHTHTRE